MVLEYKFKYVSDNSNFISILDNIVSKKDTKYSLKKEDDFIFMYIKDDEDNLIKISNEISDELPMSIFLEDFTLEVVPRFPDFPTLNYQHSPDSLKKSFCSNCLTIIEEKKSPFFYTPFVNCEICGTTCDVNEILVKENGSDFEYKNYKDLFEKLALKISQGKRVKINNYIFFKFEELKKEKEKLLCTNLDNISKVVVGSKQKCVLLQSLEKPIITFNVNTIYQSNHSSSINKVDIRTPWNLFFYLLSKELNLLNIDFLKYEKGSNFDMEILFEDEDISPKIAVTKNRILLVENKEFDKNLDKLYNNFDDKAKAQSMVLLTENNLLEKSVFNIFLSSKYDDGISLYSPKIEGLVDILNFKLPVSIKDIFTNLEKEENGQKLIENYKNRFPEIYESAKNYDITKLKHNSFLSLFEIAGIVLGIENIYDKASQALLQKGPSIDCLTNSNEKIFNKEFDITKFIKSGISFKLAGLDDKTLALGYVESFVRFIFDLYDNINEKFPLDAISLCGDLVADEFLNKLIDKSITKNIKVYYNKDFPIQY